MSRRRVLAGAAALALALVPTPIGSGRALGQTAGPAREQLKRIEDYLNAITTVKAKFLQAASTGEIATGTFYLRRPGRLRIEYDPPSPVLIVGDGHRLIYFDKELETTNMTPIEDTLAAFLARERIAFSGDVAVTDFAAEKGTVRLTLTRAGEPEGGSLTLVFDDRPLSLRLWVVTDAQGTATRVSLNDPEFGVALPDGLFEAREPDRR